MSDPFRIVHCRYFSEKGLVVLQHWRVERWTKGLLRHSWRPLRGAYGQSPTEFDSLDDARECIERIMSGTPRSAWVREPVSEGRF